MTIPARAKGDKAEREVVAALRAQGLLFVERAYGAGRPDDSGDIDGLPGFVVQIKNYADEQRAMREGLALADEQACRHHIAYPACITRGRGGVLTVHQRIEPWAALVREVIER